MCCTGSEHRTEIEVSLAPSGTRVKPEAVPLGHFAPVVDTGDGDVGLPKPFLDLGDVDVRIQSTGRVKGLAMARAVPENMSMVLNCEGRERPRRAQEFSPGNAR